MVGGPYRRKTVPVWGLMGYGAECAVAGPNLALSPRTKLWLDDEGVQGDSI